MMNSDMIEFYSDEGCVASVKSSMPPQAKQLISIRGVVYRVKRVTFALDYAGEQGKRMRANVEMTKTK